MATYTHPHGGRLEDCTEPELLARSGQEVTVVRALNDDEHDRDEVGQMFRIRFADGFEADAFGYELTGVDA